MSNVTLGKVKASFRSKMKMAVAADQFSRAVSDAVIPEEHSVSDDMVNAIDVMERRDAWSIHTVGLRLNAESQRMLSVPIRSQAFRSHWESFFEARNTGANLMMSVASAALAQNNPIAKKTKRNVKSVTLIEIGSNGSYLDVERGLLVHVWKTPEGAVNFVHGWCRVWQSLFEYHIEGIQVPMSFMYCLAGTYVSVTALPPVMIAGEAGGATVFPGDLRPDQSVLAYMAQQLMVALRIPAGDFEGLPLYRGRDGAHYLLSIREATTNRLTQFPLHTARRELLWKATLLGYKGNPDNFMKEKLIPAMVRDLWKRLQRAMFSNPKLKEKELAVLVLLKQNLLRQCLKEHGINLCMLFHVHNYALAQAKKYLDNGVPLTASTNSGSGEASPPRAISFAKSESMVMGSPSGARGSGVFSPGKILSPTSTDGGNNRSGGNGEFGEQLASDSDGDDDEKGKEDEITFAIPSNVVDLCRQIAVACRCEMVGRVLKAFCRSDFEKLRDEGKFNDRDALDAVNRVAKLTTEKLSAPFWIEHILPALRKKFGAPDTFTLGAAEVSLPNCLSIMANKLGAEFDKEEGRFNSLAKSARTDHLCFACPSYLLKTGETGKSELLIAKCWKAATAPFVERHSSLHQMLIVRACCVSLHITSSKSELVDHVLSVVAAEKPDGGAIAKLRFAALAAELPIKPETQAELIGDFYLRVKEQWTQKEDPEVKVVEDGTNLAMMLATCGRAVDQLLTDTSNVNLSPLRVETILAKFNLDAHQMKIDALTLCVKVPDINLAFCLLSQTITQELFMRIAVCNPEQREALAFILRGVILNLSVVNQEKEQAADLAIDALTAFMAKPEFYMNCTDLIVDLACEGVEANMEVFGRDSIDTQNMMYRLGKIVAAPHRISKLDSALQQLIDQAAAARHEVKKAKAASEQGRLLSQQVALLMLARKTAPVSALRKAATLTQHERAIKLLTEHAQYLGGDVRDTTAEYKHTKREQAIYLIQRVARARYGSKKLQQMVEAAHFAEQERLAKDAKQRRDAATVIQKKYIKFTAIVRAKTELNRLRKRFIAILETQSAIRSFASGLFTRLRSRVVERKRQTKVLQRVFRSRQAAAALHVDYLRFTAPNVDFLGPLIRDWHYFGYPAHGSRQRAEIALNKPRPTLLKSCYCADALHHLQFEESYERMEILREWKLLILKEQHMEDRYKSWIRVVAPLMEKRSQKAKESSSPTKQPHSQEEGKRILSGTEAASVLQRAWRCNMARFELRFRRLRYNYFRELKRRMTAAVRVQALIRGFLCRTRLSNNRSAKTQTE